MPLDLSNYSKIAGPAVFLSALCVAMSTRIVDAQQAETLPIWKAEEAEIAKLGQGFANSQFSIKLPEGLRMVETNAASEQAKTGINVFAWTPDGKLPSLTNLVVTLLPPAKPSSETLDDFIAGLKDSLDKGFEDIQFSEIERGEFNGVEARYGEFRTKAAEDGIVGYFLVGIDEFGTFSLTAMLPRENATQEKAQAVKTSLFTFVRPR